MKQTINIMKITNEIYNNKIKPLFAQSVFCSVATVTDEGLPHVSPIGSIVILNKDKGQFFEKFTKNVPKNTNKNPYATIMCVNDGKWFWLKSLISGRFKNPPAIRLVVKMGELREGTEKEGRIFKNKVKLFKKTKGYQMMWKDMSQIREFEIIDYKPVFIGHMTRDQFK